MSSGAGRADLHLHITLLVVSAAVILASFMLDATAESASLFGYRLPPMCAFRELFGIGCPGCGLTRSFVLTAHGELGGAFDLHLFGPLGWVAVFAQIPYRLLRIWRYPRETAGSESVAAPPLAE